MDKWQNIAEKKIQEAMTEGAFDNLEGAGRPIDLADDPFEPPELRMAHRLLRNNGFAPPWIEEARDLRLAKDKARGELARSWARHGRSSAETSRELWTAALQAFRDEVRLLNQRLLAYNLKAPTSRVHLSPPVAEREIKRLTSAR